MSIGLFNKPLFNVGLSESNHSTVTNGIVQKIYYNHENIIKSLIWDI